MGIKWCVCDIDGTLVDSKNKLRDETIAAVQAMRAQGVELILATGRSPLFVKELTAKLGITMPAICCNGGIIQDITGQQTLYSKNIPQQHIQGLSSYFVGAGIDALMYSPDHIYYMKGSQRINLFVNFNNRVAPEFRVPLIEIERPEQLPDTIIKFFVWDIDQQTVAYLQNEYNREQALYMVQSMQASLDIMVQGVSKGDGLSILAELKGLDLAQTAVFGDNDNDISMLRIAGCSVAMGNAEAAVKAVAKYVTSTNDENGVAQGIRRYILAENAG